MKKKMKQANKNEKLLKSFTLYCKKNPSERFWQALRNWSAVEIVYAVKKPTALPDIAAMLVDTFYWENKTE